MLQGANNCALDCARGVVVILQFALIVLHDEIISFLPDQQGLANDAKVMECCNAEEYLFSISVLIRSIEHRSSGSSGSTGAP